MMRADSAAAVFLDAHPSEEPRARPLSSVRRVVVLAENPDGRLFLAHEHASFAPHSHGLRGLLVASRQVDLDDVVAAARRQPSALLVVDHVVRRGYHLVERAHRRGVVAERAERLDFGHGRATLMEHGARLTTRQNGEMTESRERCVTHRLPP